jgi:hypothetical protein
MSVLNVNMQERDLDPEELDLEQEEEDAFGMLGPYLQVSSGHQRRWGRDIRVRGLMW